MFYEEELEPNDWVVVTNPIKHREIATIQAQAWRDLKKDEGVFVIDTLLDTGLTHDLWICDFCNAQIPVCDEEGNMLSITIWNNSRALCENCLIEFQSKWSTNNDETYNCRCGCSREEK